MDNTGQGRGRRTVKKAPYPEEILCERRLKILQHLFSFSASTVEQIGRDVFKTNGRSFPYSEMKTLERKGFVERRFFYDGGKAKGAYVLTPRGFGYCSLFEEEEIRNKKYLPSSLLHDLALVDIASSLKKLSAVRNYHTENELLAKGGHLLEEEKRELLTLRSDALMELERDGKGFFFGVEYEASRKYKDRLEEKINRFYDCPEVYGCLFVCKEKELIDRMKAVEKRENPKAKAKIYYGLSEDFQKRHKTMTFFGKDGAKLNLS